MADYRYLVTEVTTGAVVAEIPLGNVRCQSLINGAGSFFGQFTMGDPRVRASFNEIDTQPGRAGLVVLRDGAPVWGGVLWVRSYQVDTETLSIAGSEWWSALGRRKVTSDYAWNATAIETVVADLVVDAQTGTNADFGMTVAGTTGMTTTSSVLSVDRQWISDSIRAILDAAGIESKTSVTYTGGTALPVLTLGTPTLGRSGAVSGLTIAEPISGVWSEDATAWATRVYAASRSAGSTALTAVVNDTAALAGGYPRWDLDYSSDSATSSTDLEAAANTYLSARSPGGSFGPITCRATDPDLSSVQLGDEVMVTFAPNARFPGGLIADARITGWTLTPGEGGGIDVLALEISQ